jgi:hypothetical protein
MNLPLGLLLGCSSPAQRLSRVTHFYSGKTEKLGGIAVPLRHLYKRMRPSSPPIPDLGPRPLDRRADVRPGGYDGGQNAIKSRRALDATDEQTSRQTSRHHRTAERRMLWARRPWRPLVAVAAADCANPSCCGRSGRRSWIGEWCIRRTLRAEPDRRGAGSSGLRRTGGTRHGGPRSMHGARTTSSGVSRANVVSGPMVISERA